MSAKYPAISLIAGLCVSIAVSCAVGSVVLIYVAIQYDQLPLIAGVPALLLCAFWHLLLGEIVSAIASTAIETEQSNKLLRQILDELKRQSPAVPPLQAIHPRQLRSP